MRKLVLTGLLLTLSQLGHLGRPEAACAQDGGRWLDQLTPRPAATPAPSADGRLEWYQQQLKAYPEQPALYYQLGLRHQQAGRYLEASAAYEAALKLNSRLYPVIYQLALVRLELDQPEAALELVNQALAQWRVDPNLYHAKGLAHLRLKQESQARDAFYQALLLDAGHPAQAALAGLTIPGEQPEADPPAGSTPEARLAEAQALKQQKKPDQALSVLHQLLAERPDFAPAYDQLAQIAEAAGRNAEGANWREQLQVLDPCFGENPWLLGRYYYWTGYGTQALELLARQSQCRPVANASLLYAQMLLQRRQLDPALSVLQEAVRRWPQHPALHAVLAEAYLAKQQPAQAQSLVSKLLAQKPVAPEAYYVQGQLHLLAGRTGAAVASLKQALALSNRPEYRKALGLAYAQAGMSKQALSELQQYLKQRPAEAPALQPLLTQLNQQKGRGRY